VLTLVYQDEDDKGDTEKSEDGDLPAVMMALPGRPTEQPYANSPIHLASTVDRPNIFIISQFSTALYEYKLCKAFAILSSS
jgi:hypothetical protein